MKNTIKTNSLNIIKLNNKTYLPYQLHQLPKWFNKYYTEHLNIKGYCYVSLDEHYNNNKYFDSFNSYIALYSKIFTYNASKFS